MSQTQQETTTKPQQTSTETPTTSDSQSSPDMSGKGTQGAPFRSAALYVGDIHPEVSEAILFEIFNAVAPVASVRVCRHAITRRSLGYAYVNFHTIRDAERVLDTMNYTMIKGRMCRLMWSQRDPSLRKSGEGNVYIKNLDPTIDSKDLFDTFSIFGNIISCKVVTDRQTGQSKGYGFVHFETKEAAEEAIQKVSGNKICGRQVYVGNFQKRNTRLHQQQWTNLYVKNYPETYSDEDLTKLFKTFGPIQSIMCPKDDNGKFRGFAYIDMKNHEDAKSAVEKLHNSNPDDLEPGSIKVEETKKTEKTESSKDADEKSEEKSEKKTEETTRTKVLYVQRFMKRRERERIVAENKQREKTERIKSYIGKNLYVRNLADDVTDDDLNSEFQAFGTITSARVMRDDQGRSRGFGFVCFSAREEAAKALHTLNNMMFHNKPMYVAQWQPREERRQFLQRQHMAKRGGGLGPQMPGRGQPMAMGMPAYQMQLAGMGMHAYGPRGVYARPMYNQRMGPGRGFPNMYAQNMGYQGMRRQGRPNQPMPRGMPTNPQQRPFIQTQHARNVPQQMPQQNTRSPQGQMTGTDPNAPLTITALVGASPEHQKNMIGERLYPLVQEQQPDHAGKVTGMLLEGMETADLLHLLESPEALLVKVAEAMDILKGSVKEE